jgi:exopolysaccharide/PEP-CTERM locus tyrosine autokinase
MGKFTGSLEKAGYEDGLQQLTEPVRDTPPKNLKKVPPAEPPPRQEPASQPRQPATPDKSIKHLQGKWDNRLFKAINADLYLPELFKIIRSRILNPADGRAAPKTIMVTSVVPREGKSFVTANLGVSLARGLDQHCLLVDCDLRRPSLAGLFGLRDARPGLADYLRDDLSLNGLIAKTGVDKLSILPSGKPPENPAELLSSARMQTLITELSGRYDDRLIIFDSPPMLVAAESMVLAGHVDAALLVIRQGLVARAEVLKLIETIGPKRILGVVFNDFTANPFESVMAKRYGYYHGKEYA